MISNVTLRENIKAGKYDSALKKLYKATEINSQKERYIRVSNEFDEIFGAGREVEVFSAPGRTEVCGNHTDHNHGKVLAASVDLDAIAVASKNDNGIVKIKSEGHDMDIADLSNLDVIEEEFGHSNALVRGVCAGFIKWGYKVGGLMLQPHQMCFQAPDFHPLPLLRCL